MKIVLATPLYPPDIAEPAPYVKELARRIGKEHTVTVVTYGVLPEKVGGVSILSTSKKSHLLVRIVRFAVLLFQETKGADVLYVQNGPSVELPSLLVRLMRRTPMYVRLSDARARAHAKEHTLFGLLETIVVHASSGTITPPNVPDPLPRPEILPFEPTLQETMDAWETSWSSHINALLHTLTHEKH